MKHTLLPLTLLTLLAACSQTSTIPPVAFYGDGLDHSWTATSEKGQALLASLTRGGLRPQGVHLGLSLSLTAQNGWGPIEIDTSNGETAQGDGKTLTLKGQTYLTGLGVHGDSEIHIQASGLETPACTRFRADIGIDDEVGANGKYSSVVFQVFADGEKLYDSGLVTGSTPTKHLDLPMGGKSDLRFVVTKGPDLNYYDHADWAGASLSCGVPISSGPIAAWGSNTYGQLDIPAGLTGITAIETGAYHSLALKQDGTIVAWGGESNNSYGQAAVPAGLSGVKAIAAGAYHSLALRNDGTVVAWGALGRTAEGQATVPTGLKDVKAIAAGAFHSLALRNDGTVVAWGWNSEGQASVPADLNGIKAISAGGVHSLVLR